MIQRHMTISKHKDLVLRVLVGACKDYLRAGDGIFVCTPILEFKETDAEDLDLSWNFW